MVAPWVPGMGAAVVAGAGILFMHRRGIFNAGLMELQRRLQSPATQSQGAFQVFNPALGNSPPP